MFSLCKWANKHYHDTALRSLKGTRQYIVLWHVLSDTDISSARATFKQTLYNLQIKPDELCEISDTFYRAYTVLW